MVEKNKPGISKGKKIVLAFLIGIIAFQGSLALLLIPNRAEAIFGLGDLVEDPWLFAIEYYRLTREEGDRVTQGIWDALRAGAALAFKNALKVFFGNLAKTTAEWIASGGESQSPLMYFQSWDSFVENAGDAMLGDFLQTLATENGLLSFNLCSPDASFNINLGWGMINALQPRQPECTFSQMYKSWNDTLQDPEFLKNFAVSWGPTQNPLGVSLDAEAQLYEKISKAEQAAIVERAFGSTYRDVKSGVAEYIETPGKMVAKQWESSADSAAGKAIASYTGEIVADTVDIFTSTLVSKLMEKMMGGMFSLADLIKEEQELRGEDIFGSYAGTQSLSQAAAEANFADITQAPLISGGSYSVLDELSTCPNNEDQRGYLNCTIDSGFRTAIEQQMTVGEALDEGLLNSGIPFAFASQNTGIDRPENGYSYRSILILRKYRIVPVGWQLAAEYIRDFSGGTFALGGLVDDSQLCSEDNYSPFCGLLEPDWVLKIPETYCKKMGYGSELAVDNPISDGNDYNPDSQLVIRKEQCVDDQSCLEEDENGDCVAYGYCTKEERYYTLGGKQCDPQNQSCLVYTDVETKQKYSYLSNNLNYSSCDSSNVGCDWYCRFKNVDGNWDCPNGPEINKTINLDNNALACDSENAGCTQFIRTTDRSNLIANSGFEYLDLSQPVGPYVLNSQTQFKNWNVGTNGGSEWTNVEVVDKTIDPDNVFAGNNSMKITGTDSGGNNVGYLFDTKRSLASRTFYFSFYAKAVGACDNYRYDLNPVGETIASDRINFETDGEWHWYNKEYTFPSDPFNVDIHDDEGNGKYVDANGHRRAVLALFKSVDGCALFVDNVKVEEVIPPAYLSAAGFSNYRSEKDLVYLTGQRLACSADEVGCELFTPQGKDATYAIPAKITNPAEDICENDYISHECSQCLESQVGCDFFEETPLEAGQPEPAVAERTGNYCSLNQSIPCADNADCLLGTVYSGLCQPSISMIPSTGEQCSVQEVGCEKYTNLDIQAAGGEGLEYYSKIRQCVLEDDPEAANYYTWVGSDTQGYQLQTFNLKKSNVDGAPCTNLAYSTGETYGPPFNCVDENIMVPELGQRPIASCTEADLETNPDCRQFLDAQGNVYYRLMSRTITVSEDCQPMRNSLDENVYYAIPAESVSCSAVGCREYKGNAGYNVQEIINDDFEYNQAWEGGDLSNESLQVGGHSLFIGSHLDTPGFVTNAAFEDVDNLDNETSYILHFWAKGGSGSENNLRAFFHTDNEDVPENQRTIIFNADPIVLSAGWQYYSLGPITFSDETHLFQNDEVFGFVVSGMNAPDAYIDNVLLRKNENFYLIKDSFNLCQKYEGCREYEDRAGEAHYLKSFESLCGENKVGCEALINTYNSSYAWEQSWQNENDPPYITLKDDVTVSTDEVEFWVNDSEKYCGADQKGCEELGEPVVRQSSGLIEDYVETYLINNPDDYDTILCQDNELSCGQYVGADGSTYYFRDPGNRICEYKAVEKSNGTEYAWYMEGSDSKCPVINKNDAYTQPRGAICVGGPRAFLPCNYDQDCDLGIIPGQVLEEYNGKCVSYSGYENSFGVCLFYDETDPSNNYVPDPGEIPSMQSCEDNTQCGENEECNHVRAKSGYMFASTIDSTDALTLGEFITEVCGSYNRNDIPAYLQEMCSNEDYYSEVGELADSGWVGLCPAGQTGCTLYLDPNGENIVRNPSFESDAYKFYNLNDNHKLVGKVDSISKEPDGVPDGWDIAPEPGPDLFNHPYRNNNCQVERITSDGDDSNGQEVHEGQYSLKLTKVRNPEWPTQPLNPNTWINIANSPGCGIYSTDYTHLSLSQSTEAFTVGAWVRNATDLETNITVGVRIYTVAEYETICDDPNTSGVVEKCLSDARRTYHAGNWAGSQGKPVAAFNQTLTAMTNPKDNEWVLYQGTIGPFEKYLFPTSGGFYIKFALYGPSYQGPFNISNIDFTGNWLQGLVQEAWDALYWTEPNDQAIYVDDVFINRNTEYNYIDKSVNGTIESGDAKCTSVDPEVAGCVAFRDTTRRQQTINSSGLSCSSCEINSPYATQDCRNEANSCDTNVIIKVENNRRCQQWLDCDTYREVVDENDKSTKVCFSLGACDEFSPSGGNCISYVPKQNTNAIEPLMYESMPNNNDQLFLIKNLSGYIKVGMIWDTTDSSESEAGAAAGSGGLAWSGGGVIGFGIGHYHTISQTSKVIPGYYPFQDMFETGLSAAGSNDELVDKMNFGFEGYYCEEGGSNGQYTTCVNNNECRYLDNDGDPVEAGDEIWCTAEKSVGNSDDDSEYWYSSDDTAKILNFPLGRNTNFATDKDYLSDGSPIDINNVLQFKIDVEAKKISLINSGIYTLSFDASLAMTTESNADQLRVAFTFEDEEGDPLTSQSITLKCAGGPDNGKECLPDLPINCSYSESEGKIVCEDAGPGDSSCRGVGINCSNTGAVDLTTDWQKIILGPVLVEFPDEAVADKVGIKFINMASDDTEIRLDNVSLKPVLEVVDLSAYHQLDEMNKDSLGSGDILDGVISLARSCRAYPTESSLACNYVDNSGYIYRGWKGYCLETDPVDPQRCLMWYPVDIISAESDLYGRDEAGYAGVTPLYYCLAAKGLSPLVRGKGFEYVKLNGGSPPEAKYGVGKVGLDISSVFPVSDQHYLRKKGLSFMYKPADFQKIAGRENQIPDDLYWADLKGILLVRARGGGPINLYLGKNGQCWGNTGNRLTHQLEDEGGANACTEEPLELGLDCPSGDSFCGESHRCRGENVTIGGMCYGHSFEVPPSYPPDPPNTTYHYEGIQEVFPEATHVWYHVDVNDSIAINFAVVMKEEEEGTYKIIGYALGGYIEDNSETTSIYRPFFFLEDYCEEVVQVVANDTTNFAWSNRLEEDSTYKVPVLKYDYDTGDGYYGALLNLGAWAPSPESWEGKLQVEQADKYRVPDVDGGDPINKVEEGFTESGPWQERVSTFYACGGFCEGKSDSSCVGRTEDLGQSCADKDEPDWYCEENYVGDKDCWYETVAGLSGDCKYTSKGSNSLCIGNSGNEIYSTSIRTSFEAGADRLKFLFAKPINSWHWSDSDGKYVESDDKSYWNDQFGNMPLCGSTRDDSEYCGIQPKVIKPQVNGVEEDVEIVSGSTIQVSFGAQVNPEQVPLAKIVIKWGDGEILVDPWDGAAKEEHVYTHAYTNSTAAEIAQFQPEIILVDNWGWCSGDDGTLEQKRTVDANGNFDDVLKENGCSSWTATQNKVLVERELVF